MEVGTAPAQDPGVAKIREIAAGVSWFNTPEGRFHIKRAAESPEGRQSLALLQESHAEWHETLRGAELIFRASLKSIRKALRKPWALWA